jgi:hypothetical protein
MPYIDCISRGSLTSVFYLEYPEMTISNSLVEASRFHISPWATTTGEGHHLLPVSHRILLGCFDEEVLYRESDSKDFVLLGSYFKVVKL